jgi:hypothetical protein
MLLRYQLGRATIWIMSWASRSNRFNLALVQSLGISVDYSMCSSHLSKRSA